MIWSQSESRPSRRGVMQTSPHCMALNCHPIGGGRSWESVPKFRRRTILVTSTIISKMDAAPIFSSLHLISSLNNYPSTRRFIANHPTYYGSNLCPFSVNKPPILVKRIIASTSRASAVINDDISAITWDPAQAEITWQIVIGALAGVTPFVVAGIEFSKRIVEQRKCKVCKGSGLVLRDNKYYFRCPRCGGFLPWQSWRRFFTG